MRTVAADICACCVCVLVHLAPCLRVVACFWLVVCGALRFRGCAFPLVMLSRSIFPLVLAFRGVGCVLGGVSAVNALVSRF